MKIGLTHSEIAIVIFLDRPTLLCPVITNIGEVGSPDKGAHFSPKLGPGSFTALWVGVGITQVSVLEKMLTLLSYLGPRKRIL